MMEGDSVTVIENDTGTSVTVRLTEEWHWWGVIKV